MQLLDILNQVLIKRRESPLTANGLGTTWQSNGLVRLYSVFLDETCREIANAGTIEGTVVTRSVNPTGLVDTVTYVNVGGSPEAFLRHIKMFDIKNRKEVPLSHQSVVDRLYKTNFVASTSGPLEAASLVVSNINPTPTFTLIRVYPNVDPTMTIELQSSVNWFQWLKANNQLNDTANFAPPAHLLILGTYEKALKEVYGADDPKAIDARQAYQGALASELAQDGQMFGSGVDQWNPV
jgi:hypothetical protein